MTRKPIEDDVVLGNLSRMSALNGTPNATTIWLQQHGKIPITRIGPLWAVNARALERAREAAFRSHEKWAIEATRKLEAKAGASEDERECEVA
jgi:hypothetical protein